MSAFIRPSSSPVHRGPERRSLRNHSFRGRSTYSRTLMRRCAHLRRMHGSARLVCKRVVMKQLARIRSSNRLR